jgi:hypothetical protein
MKAEYFYVNADRYLLRVCQRVKVPQIRLSGKGASIPPEKLK